MLVQPCSVCTGGDDAHKKMSIHMLMVARGPRKSKMTYEVLLQSLV